MYKIGGFWMEVVLDCYGLDGNGHVLLPLLPVHAIRVTEIPHGQRQG